MEPNLNNESTTSYHKPAGAAKAGLTMASAALIFGAVSLLTILTIFLPLILGSVAIVLALLSKGREPKMLTQAKVGLSCGIAGLSVVFAMLSSSVATAFSYPEILPEYGRMVDTFYEEYYNTSIEELIGFSYEEQLEDLAEKITSLKERRLP